MNIVAWLVFGFIAGVLANAIDPNRAQGGIVGAIVLGILGAIVGGFIGNLLFGLGVTGFNLSSFLIAVVGSLIVLATGRAMRRTSY